MQEIRPGIVTPSRLPPIDTRLRNVEKLGTGFMASWKNLIIRVTESLELDGRWWRHASVSRSDRKLPTYQNLRDLKDLTIGPDRTAIQVFPPADKDVDIGGKMPHPVQVLHLWSCDDKVLPDFTRGGNTI